MPEFLEKRLKKKYGEKSSVPYKIMNKIGAMHGNKETKKGQEMEKKHALGLGSENKKVVHHEMKKKKKKSFAEALTK
jgi:hypothetical protein